MGVQDVRRVIVAYLSTPPLPGLVTVFRGEPVIMDGEDWAPALSTGWGAGSYVHIGEQAERRIAFGGAPPGGVKEITYACALVVVYRWIIPGDGNPTGEADGWTEPFDGLLDSIKTRMRADRTFGNGASGPVWQAGEGDADMRVQMDLPRIDDGQVLVWAALEFEVVEMVNA